MLLLRNCYNLFYAYHAELWEVLSHLSKIYTTLRSLSYSPILSDTPLSVEVYHIWNFLYHLLLPISLSVPLLIRGFSCITYLFLSFLFLFCTKFVSSLPILFIIICFFSSAFAAKVLNNRMRSLMLVRWDWLLRAEMRCNFCAILSLPQNKEMIQNITLLIRKNNDHLNS